MILLVHTKGKDIVRALHNDQELDLKAKNCTAGLWELAMRFPEEVIGWCEASFYSNLQLEEWATVFHHDWIMASYAVQNAFLPEQLGYIDQLPFIRVNREVLYGTWQMSSDVGGVKGEVLLLFEELLEKEGNFAYLLNSIAKLGQQNSLFCYSAPQLVKKKAAEVLQYRASTSQLFAFVYQHYNTVWTVILLWCYFKYEKKLPLLAFVKSFSLRKLFQKKVNLTEVGVRSSKKPTEVDSIDVIIPTMGRANYLYQVLRDFARQTHLPKKIIIVEQNPDETALSELPFLEDKEWPFEIVHRLIHQVGACNARNIALAMTTAHYVFFSDDDQRFDKDLIENVFGEIKKYGVDGLTTSYLQARESKIFEVPKQWGTFGAGNSVILGKYARRIKFHTAYEHGYGEDKDYGMQLRNQGCDIIYHPGLEIEHLKAPIGGFRSKNKREWELAELSPKPSPTIMIYGLRHYSPEQMRGYKTSLFIRFYQKQGVKNPIAYIRHMRKRWRKSEEYAVFLQEKAS